MRSVTIYYDDEKSICREYIEIFSEYEGITCKKVTDFGDTPIIFEDNDHVGFLFESTKEKIPSAVRHVIERLIMNKKGRCFVAVTGGRREMAALREANMELAKRGYQVKNVYSQYLFEKSHMDIIKAVEKMMEDAENELNNLELYKQRVEEHTNRQIRKYMRRELRAYKDYRKKNRHKTADHDKN